MFKNLFTIEKNTIITLQRSLLPTTKEGRQTKANRSNQERAETSFPCFFSSQTIRKQYERKPTKRLPPIIIHRQVKSNPHHRAAKLKSSYYASCSQPKSPKSSCQQVCCAQNQLTFSVRLSGWKSVCGGIVMLALKAWLSSLCWLSKLATTTKSL